MHNGKRRIFAILGLALLAMALVFPASVAAKPHRTIPADLLGDHVWTGQLCDGTAVSVKYHVASDGTVVYDCLLYTSPSPRDRTRSRMPSSA